MHPQPPACTPQVYAALVQCWSFEPEKRAGFPALAAFFADLSGSTAAASTPGSFARGSLPNHAAQNHGFGGAPSGYDLNFAELDQHGSAAEKGEHDLGAAATKRNDYSLGHSASGNGEYDLGHTSVQAKPNEYDLGHSASGNGEYDLGHASTQAVPRADTYAIASGAATTPLVAGTTKETRFGGAQSDDSNSDVDL